MQEIKDAVLGIKIIIIYVYYIIFKFYFWFNFSPATSTTITSTVPIPENFNKIASQVFVVNGKEHAQEAHYNEDTNELILTNPEHSGFSESVTAVTPSNGEDLDKTMTCQESCYYNDAHEELGLNPQNFMEATRKRNRNVHKVDANNITKVFVVRKDHRLMTSAELETLPESMKAIRNILNYWI